ncbi:MAG TPA: hypothetical protein VM492_12235 [Sumerlaeia bacterium]|nr:hypothetical protein [Sumerlaeia bacterium]
MRDDWRNQSAFLLFGEEIAPDTVLDDFEGFVGGLAQRPSAPVHLFEAFLDRTQDHGIRVILLNPPVSERMFARLSEIGALAAYERTMARWRGEYGNLGLSNPLFRFAPTTDLGTWAASMRAGTPSSGDSMLTRYGLSPWTPRARGGATGRKAPKIALGLRIDGDAV